MTYVVTTRVKSIRQITDKVWQSGVGESAVFNEVSRGWYMFLESSYEGLFIGHDKPDDLKAGDTIRMTFEVVP